MRDVAPIPEVAAPAGVEIRPARPGDARSYLQMWRGVVAEKRFVRTERVARPASAYRKVFRHSWTDRQAWILAIADGEVVGSISLSREEHPVNRHVATVGMSVDKAWRGRGIGAALLSEGLQWANQVGVEKVALSVYPNNEPAAALYRKFGFVEEGRLVGHSKKSYGYEDEVVMARWMR
jgi:RimJ/RimL family protein N-acetyltransferase